MERDQADQGKPAIGWREWVALPQLAIPRIKAKIDTGARSSALHAIAVRTYELGGKEYVSFKVHPRQRDTKLTVVAEAEVLEYRPVRSSTGHLTTRPVIKTDVEILGKRWPIELTLTNRDEMGFRMLLGREAIRGRLLVDPGRSYYGGKPVRKKTKKTTKKKRKKTKTMKRNRQAVTEPASGKRKKKRKREGESQ
jgi:hypothetical protein